MVRRRRDKGMRERLGVGLTLAVLALAPEEGLGVTNHELRAKVGDKLHAFRR